jgi:glucarate dehydratase
MPWSESGVRSRALSAATSWKRRDVLALIGAGALAQLRAKAAAATPAKEPLRIGELRFTPVALPDPPILAASGCHGPYFLRTIVELSTNAGIVGIGETRCDEPVLAALAKARERLLGRNAFAYRAFAPELIAANRAAYAGIELACLDACGKATGRRVVELLGGPLREEVEFAAYLFYRYAADDARLLRDPRIADARGRGERALDDWGEVRTAEAMAAMAERFKARWGFRCFKLKGGVLAPDAELATMHAMNERFSAKHPLRIDPNARWTVATALRVAAGLKGLPLEYYEDPVEGQEGMAEVRRRTGLPLSTNMCVTRFEHVAPAQRLGAIDVVLADHHYWGGIPACQELGRVCEALGWKMSQHSNNHAGVTMAAMIAVAAVSPQLTLPSDTHYPWLVAGADVIEGRNLEIRDGRMAVPKGAGLGVSLDRDKLARAHETYTKCGMRGRDDAFTMRLVEPGWKRELF